MTQRVLITAGASGIGLAIAKTFTADGARVHICDINAQAVKDAIASDPAISGSVTDVGEPNAVIALFDDVKNSLGGLDVLVNNAGIAGPTVPIEEYELTDWNKVMNVNVTATFLVTKAAIPMLKQSDQASIIVMSSVAGRFGYPNRIAYSSSKWALVGFAKTLSMELGPLGITCNTIHPGAVEGARVMSVFEGRAKISGLTVQDEIDKALANQSIKKFIDPNDIAQLVKFLSGKYARTISGQTFPIDGDMKSTQ